jgi:heme exporter protein CcmD
VKDYSFYIAAAYGLAALVLGILVLQSWLAAKRAQKLAGRDDA